MDLKSVFSMGRKIPRKKWTLKKGFRPRFPDKRVSTFTPQIEPKVRNFETKWNIHYKNFVFQLFTTTAWRHYSFRRTVRRYHGARRGSCQFKFLGIFASAHEIRINSRTNNYYKLRLLTNLDHVLNDTGARICTNCGFLPYQPTVTNRVWRRALQMLNENEYALSGFQVYHVFFSKLWQFIWIVTQNIGGTSFWNRVFLFLNGFCLLQFSLCKNTTVR